MRKDESFGVVPLRKGPRGYEAFLIQHRRSSYWGLPKGHKEEGETPFETACRELKEETNLDFDELIYEEPLVEEYQFTADGKPVLKRVFYFIALVKGDVFLQPEEIKDGLWLPIEQAVEKLTHSEAKSILSQAIKHVKS
jgi:8-oxo-dGTP pyrophosphatase MutT (NUDIX family)